MDLQIFISLHISGGQVNVSLKLLAERSDDGQTDALVTARYHSNLDSHVWLQKEKSVNELINNH